MKHKVIIAGLLLVLAGALFAAAPLSRNFKGSASIAATVVDSQSTGYWKLMDSAIVVASDSACTVFRVTGEVDLDPGDYLYVGLANDSAHKGNVPNLDTAYVNLSQSARGRSHQTFNVCYPNTTNGANTDTFYVFMACGGRSKNEYVTVTNLKLTASVADQ